MYGDFMDTNGLMDIGGLKSIGLISESIRGRRCIASNVIKSSHAFARFAKCVQ